jgi:hypothetical protein
MFVYPYVIFQHSNRKTIQTLYVLRHIEARSRNHNCSGKAMSIYHCDGPGSSVGIANDHGLDGPGSNPGGDEIFHRSRPALGPTQPPVKRVPGLSPGVKCGRGVLLTVHPLLVPRSWKNRVIPLPTLWATPGL